jgi:preprotein translocase subunit SecB
MPDSPDLPLAAVQVVALRLNALSFKRTGEAEDVEGLQMTVGVATSRPARDRLGVDLHVNCEAKGSFEARVSYRAYFARTVPFDVDEDEVSFWKNVVANIATLVLFPYVRVALSTVVSQSDMAPFTLPLVNPAAMFSAEQIQIADLPEQDSTGRLGLEEASIGNDLDSG